MPSPVPLPSALHRRHQLLFLAQRFTEIVGTPFYMAPEVLERSYGQEADIWSVGVVAFLMLAGCLPFNGHTDRQIIKAVLDSVPDFDSPAWEGISSTAKDCVKLMLQKNPQQRAGIEQLLAHPWLQGRPRSSCCNGSDSSASGAGCRFCSAAGSSSSSASGSCRSSFEQERQQGSGASSAKASGGGVSWAFPCAVELQDDDISTPRHHPVSPKQPQLSPLRK